MRLHQLSFALVVGVAVLGACSSETASDRVLVVTAVASRASVSPTGEVQVKSGTTQTFTVTPDANEHLLTTVGGSCPEGTWSDNQYTTGPIVSSCVVAFRAARNTASVTSSGTDVTISPTAAQTIEIGSQAPFTVSVEAGYTRATEVGGTCPAGSWNGETYLTGAVTGDCTVSFSATHNKYPVTPRGDHLTVDPATSTETLHGDKATFTVTPDAGYDLLTTVGGNCPAGTWNENKYTTGAVTVACTVVFNVQLRSYVVLTSGDHLTVAPAGAQNVDHGTTLSLTVTPDVGYTVSPTVAGTCPAGEWNGDVYTTGVVTGACDVQFSATLNAYAVSPLGTNVTIAPAEVQTIDHGDTASFTVAGTTGYTRTSVVGGNCAAGAWNGDVYTTGTITGPCSVEFGATLNVYDVTASGANVTFAPTTTQAVNHGAFATYLVTDTVAYSHTQQVDGTCPAGTWDGNTYRTGLLTGPCTVVFNASLNTYSVTSSGTNVSINPNTAQSIGYGTTASFTVTGATGYTVNTAVGGSCAAGTWNGNVYTTGAISGPCSVQFSATLNTYAVGSSGTNVAVSPTGARTVNHGSTLSYTVTPNANYDRSSLVGGTCPGGSWSGNTYTTGAITGACDVQFNGTLKTYLVSLASTGVTVAPSTTQSVSHGSTLTVTVTANNGATRSNTVRGNCPAGTWNGNDYTTGTITADCKLSFASKAVFVYSAGTFNGVLGNRTTTTQKCQDAFVNASGAASNLHCSSFAPLLGYAPNGVTDLPTALFVPTNLPVLGTNGTQLSNDWNAFLNLTGDVSGALINAGVLFNSSNGDRGWSGFTTGGGLDENCSDWTNGNGFARRAGPTGWSHSSGGCGNEYVQLMCLCWNP